MTPAAAAARQTAEERREAVLDAATREFGLKGLHGGSTEVIAREAGISQPYLFRLFGTKKELYLETMRRSMRRTYALMTDAAYGKRGEEALAAMGDVYRAMIAEDRDALWLQLQCHASCADPDVRAEVRALWRDLTELVERVSGGDGEVVSRFFATGMLLNTLMAMNVFDEPTDWGMRLTQGCTSWLDEE